MCLDLDVRDNMKCTFSLEEALLWTCYSTVKVKGIVLPKMKILSSYIHPHVFTNVINLFQLLFHIFYEFWKPNS